MTKSRILVVEDDDIVAFDLERRLKKLGYACVGVVATAESAVEKADELNPDLVLMDIMLRGARDGVEAGQEIRERFDIPIIFLTSCCDPATIERAKVSEPVGYILKPVEERALQTAIELGLHKHDSERKLRKMERWLANTLNSLGDAVISTDVDGGISYMNAVAQRMTGWSWDDAIGRPFEEVFNVIHETTREPMANPVTRVLAEGCPVTMPPGAVLLPRDGREIPIDDTATPVKSERGKVTGVAVVFRDISQRKEMQETQRKADEQLNQVQRMEIIGRLAGGIAHDFNNLMTVVLGHSNLLLAELPPDDPRRRRVQAVLNAGETATSLTRQLLAYSRKQVLKPVLCNLSSYVADTRQLLQQILGDDIKLTVVDPEPKLMPVKVDLGQFQQILLNLAANARDAMPKGGKVHIGVANVEIKRDEEWSGLPSGNFICLKFSDTGSGMDRQTREHIFEPFFTRKDTGKKSAGMGLATVYGIVKQSGGHIDVVSEVGKGTEFSIYFPRALEAIPAARSSSVLDAVVTGGHTILLAEDDDDVRELLSHVLVNAGYTVISAVNGKEALAKLEQHAGPIELLLTDVVMPEMNGVELSEIVAKKIPNIRMMFMSGYSKDLLDNKDGMLPEHICFLEKPVSPFKLLNKIQKLMGKAN